MTMNQPPMIVTSNQITIILNGRSYIADTTHGNYSLITQAIKEKRWDDLEGLFDIKTALGKWSEDQYVITDDGVFFGEARLQPALEKRVLQFFEEGIDFQYLLNFHKRLQANPSKRAVDELYKFLEHENIPIDEEGYFYAYKSVKENWTDHHSGKCLNTIGTELSMSRNSVDDDANRGCSHGYHVGSLAYASSFGGYGRTGARLLICRIDPADVVSVPHDCAHQKVRTCRYTVISEYTGPLPETIYRSHVDDDDEDEDDDDFNWDDDDDFDEWDEEEDTTF